MIRRSRQPRRAFTLLELIAIMPLVGLILYTAISGYRLQSTTQRRIAEQAHRQSIMRAVLNSLRADMAQARALNYAAGSVEAGLEGEQRIECSVHLTTLRGIVRYELIARDPVFNQAGTTMPPPPARRTVVRTDVDGTEKRWSLFGSVLSVEPRSLGDGDISSLAVRFQSRLRFDTGTQTVRTYETTLRLGGRP